MLVTTTVEMDCVGSIAAASDNGQNVVRICPFPLIVVVTVLMIAKEREVEHFSLEHEVKVTVIVDLGSEE